MLILIVAWFTRSSAVCTALVVCALILLQPVGCFFVLLNPWLVDARFRTYRAFYRDVQVGMTRAQVLAAMERRYPVGDARRRPTIMSDTATALGFFMNPETSREPNCEGIFLTLAHDRVTKKEYSPD